MVPVDRLYDRDVPVLSSGVPLDRIPDELLVGGDGKKDLQATSRITALARPAWETGVDCVTGKEGNGLMRLSSQEVA